jgi:hypothetical protein
MSSHGNLLYHALPRKPLITHDNCIVSYKLSPTSFCLFIIFTTSLGKGRLSISKGGQSINKGGQSIIFAKSNLVATFLAPVHQLI